MYEREPRRWRSLAGDPLGYLPGAAGRSVLGWWQPRARVPAGAAGARVAEGHRAAAGRPGPSSPRGMGIAPPVPTAAPAATAPGSRRGPCAAGTARHGVGIAEGDCLGSCAGPFGRCPCSRAGSGSTACVAKADWLSGVDWPLRRGASRFHQPRNLGVPRLCGPQACSACRCGGSAFAPAWHGRRPTHLRRGCGPALHRCRGRGPCR
mmetsp:Transcript_108236/g.345681  ORF Transcript_108236/g.345681 Transcript_108236/m.345681 type:complete len:207 (-) Transcript_108236:628-1248(-)